MSKIKLTGHASGTGVLTVTAPNTSTDRTITLPDSTGTILDENSSLPAANLTGTVADARISTLTASKLTGALPALDGSSLTGVSGGKVLQVISTTKKDTFSSSSSSFVDITGLSVSITPSLTTSKILVFGVTYMGNLSGDMTTKIVRGSTDIVLGDADGSRRRATTSGSLRQTYESLAHPFNFLDEPSTQSATTYKIQAVGGGTWYINRTDNNNDNTGHERVVSTITVMEIGA